MRRSHLHSCFHTVWISFLLFSKAVADDSCFDALALLEDSPLAKTDNFQLVLHRSGEPEPCGIATYNKDAFQTALTSVLKGKGCKAKAVNKFELEATLTAFFRDQLDATECGSLDNATAPVGLTGFCDMGPDRTTIQPDNSRLVRHNGDEENGNLPCRFFTREGKRFSRIEEIVEFAQKALETSKNCDDEDQTCASGPALHLYAVPAGRMFMFAPSFVGEKFILDHVEGSTDEEDPKPIVVETISLNPRLFEIYDFFSKEEARHLIRKVLMEKDEDLGLHRSRTGATSKTIYHKRTSENAWDTKGTVSMRIKERCLDTLGFDEYWNSHTDGLQILRYQNNQAYIAHHDYLKTSQVKTDPYDYDTAKKGGNRFATILLYMTDLGEQDGGETLFQKGQRPGFDDMPGNDRALELLRESGDPNLAVLEQGSWEETMTAMCRSRLSIQPREGRAVLFYSQLPNGEQDHSVLHGGCPVLNGTKWAANLWVWNAPRTGQKFAPQREGMDGPLPPGTDIYVTFRNDNNDPKMEKAEIWWKDKKSYGALEPGGTFRAKTYKDHVWNIKLDGETLKTFTISGEEEEEVFEY